MPNQLLDAARGHVPESLYLPTPTAQIHRLANSVQIDIHEGVLQPDEWQPVIDAVRTWLAQFHGPSTTPDIPPLPIDAITEMLEASELEADYDIDNGGEMPPYIPPIRTWIDALQLHAQA